MNEPEWTAPPPPEEGRSIYSAGTREYYAGEIRKKTTQSLIFGVLSLICCGLIFGFLGINAANDAITNIDVYEVETDRRGLAVAGKVLSIVGLVIWILSIVARLLLSFAGGGIR